MSRRNERDWQVDAYRMHQKDQKNARKREARQNLSPVSAGDVVYGGVAGGVGGGTLLFAADLVFRLPEPASIVAGTLVGVAAGSIAIVASRRQ